MASKSATDTPLGIDEIKKAIREIPDFPRPGINFYDVSTLFREPAAFGSAVERMARPFRGGDVDIVAGIEARGFVLGAALARELDLGFLMIRKLGKLPGETEGESYELEYGNARIEIHRDALDSGQRVLVVDDLLATGGTAAAAGRLIERLGAKVASYAFMIELKFLEGRSRLGDREIFSLLEYA